MNNRFKPVRWTLAAAMAVATVSLLAPFCRADGPNHPTEEQTLTHAYRVLSLAKHDYEGHRVNAMHAVEKAGKEMNLDVHKDDHTRINQGESDDMMREAERDLQNVRTVAEDRHQDRMIAHVNEAIQEIHVALGMK